MKKFIISICTICLVFVAVFAGCAKSEEEKRRELFLFLTKESVESDYISFQINRAETHFKYKFSGEYDDVPWEEASIYAVVLWDYNRAKYENWYQECLRKNGDVDAESLTEAFLESYQIDIKNTEISCSWDNIYGNRIYIKYYEYEVDKFYKDYPKIKSMLEAFYVAALKLFYDYSVPPDLIYDA